MANENPPYKGVAWSTRVALEDYANPGNFKVNPTLAVGDWQIDIDGGGFGNITTPPSVSPAGSRVVLISLSAAEMNGDVITIQGVDQTSPKEWSDLILTILTL